MVNPEALVSHILSQTRQNIEFLISQGEITPADGGDILAKLPSTTRSSVNVDLLSNQTSRLALTAPSPISSQSFPSAGPTSAQPGLRLQPPPVHKAVQARALWDYNQDPNDLSFRAGDVIEIVEETNADWWTGRLNNRTALFPSNYVEKINAHSDPSTSSPYSNRDNAGSLTAYPAGPPYAPPAQPYQNSGPAVYNSPPPTAYNNPYGASPQAITASPQPPPAEQPPKKHKFGGLGSTLAQSAVGSVGFGAGSAVGSGIINSIF